MSSGCQLDSENSDHEPFESERAELVFGQGRSVEATRGMLERARHKPEVYSGVSERNYFFSAMMQNRATGHVWSRKNIEQNELCDSRLSGGSSFLTSDTRLVTAWHVWDGHLDETLPVYFELATTPQGAAVDYGDIFSWSRYLADGPNSALPFDDEGRIHGYDLDEEQPLLPNRLFILGLDDWAGQGADLVRLDLQRWEFVPDVFQPGETGYSQPTEFGQGFVTQNGASSLEGQDIVILRALPLSGEDIDPALGELLSGSFSIDRPAVFFGKTFPAEFHRLQAQELRQLERDKLFVNSSMNRWPTNSTPWRSLLISFKAQFQNRNESAVRSFQPNCSEPTLSFTTTELFGSSHDILAGSSGGSFLMPERNLEITESGDDDHIPQWPLKAVGVVSGGTHDQQPDPHDTQWLEPLQVSPSQHAIHTKFKEGDVARVKRDPHPNNGDPANPIPILVANSSPTCLEWAGVPNESQCIEWSDQSIVSGPISGGGGGIIEYDEEALQEPAVNRQRGIGCRLSGIDGPGVVVGVHGGFNHREEEFSKPPSTLAANGGGLGSFYIICAPYSAVSYTENWRFIRVKGAGIPRELDTLSGPFKWGVFDEYFSRVYERRFQDQYTENHMVRPASAKMCPPNYVVGGIRFVLSSDQSRYIGVNSLLCRLPVSSTVQDVPNELEVALQPSQPPGYTLHGKEFSLEQHIGYPDCAVGYCAEALCPGNDVMRGVRTFHDPNGIVTDVKLKCGNSP